jgi:hypothetical protein
MFSTVSAVSLDGYYTESNTQWNLVYTWSVNAEFAVEKAGHISTIFKWKSSSTIIVVSYSVFTIKLQPHNYFR